MNRRGEAATAPRAGRLGPAARAALWTVPLSVALLAVHALVHWHQTGFVVMSDFFDLSVYRAGGEALREGTPLYEQRLGGGQFSFTYPPFAALLFAPLTVLPLGLWQALVFPVGLAMLAGTVLLVLRAAGVRGRPAWAWCAALTALLLWLEPVAWTLYLGQVNLALMLLIVADLAGGGSPGRARLRGVGVGIAAGIKLTPAIFVAYLLLTRQYRAAATASATAAATVGLGFLAAGSDSLDYWGGTFLESERIGEVASQMNQSVHGTVARLTDTAEPSLLVWGPPALLLAVLGLALAAVAHRRGLPLLGLSLCGLTGAAVSPISWSHHWVWFVPLVVLAACARPWPPRLAVPALAVFALLTLAWPVHFFTGHRMDRPPLGLVALPEWHGLELLYVNGYLLLYAGTLALCAATLRTRRPAGTGEATRRGSPARPPAPDGAR
ncbi:glycosyltransferase 87 family protein [Streptomyces physcomitrii]|uniref:glycosyltransferase 87 family protein n=1 Tax=Streptomyces physcomitrii TaxID=2724184 RepID=UPI00343223BC